MFRFHKLNVEINENNGTKMTIKQSELKDTMVALLVAEKIKGKMGTL